MRARRASSSGCGPAPGRSKGRPLGFDRDEALDAVVSLFWRHGYDGVSLAMLEHAAGISKPSLYNSFGNKEELFRLALDRYELEAPGLKLAQLDAAVSIGEAIHLLLRGAAATFGCRDGSMGCMILTGTIASHPDNRDLVAELGRRRTAFSARLAARLSRWVVPERAHVLARCLMTTIQGMALQAHDGADHAALREIADSVALAFDRWPSAIVPTAGAARAT